MLCRLLPKPPVPPGEAQSEAAPQVVIVCGKGNNGGDGFVIARHLGLRGIDVRVLMLADPKDLTGDAAANYQIIAKAGLRIVPFAASELAGATWLVDAILGTGATGEPKSPLAEAIDAMNASGIPILAVDVPSGLDCDTGAAAKHTIRASPHVHIRRREARIFCARRRTIRRPIARAGYRRATEVARRGSGD